MSQHVCVTGASGFLGSHIVENLLEQGCTVTALFRHETAHLRWLAAAQPALILRRHDLAQGTTEDNPFLGCDAVIHCAASVTNNARPGSRLWKQTLEMNIDGTHAVVRGVQQAPSVRSLVHTSSMAAILSPDKPADYTFSEADWNRQPLEASDPYWYSKTVAEQIVAAAFEETAPDRRLVCINPSVIIGPVRDPRHAHSSVAILQDLHSGKTPACPDLNFHFVDVRDLADLHVRAALDDQVRGRFIVPGHEMSMLALAAAIKQQFPDSKAPQRRAPDWLVYLGALFNPQLSRRYLQQNLGVRRQFDDSRARRRFNLHYRPLEQSIADTLRSLT